jgi:hypothetical protein
LEKSSSNAGIALLAMQHLRNVLLHLRYPRRCSYFCSYLCRYYSFLNADLAMKNGGSVPGNNASDVEVRRLELVGSGESDLWLLSDQISGKELPKATKRRRALAE